MMMTKQKRNLLMGIAAHLLCPGHDCNDCKAEFGLRMCPTSVTPIDLKAEFGRKILDYLNNPESFDKIRTVTDDELVKILMEM